MLSNVENIILLTPIQILQIDATIIAGILILLTLISFQPSSLDEQKLEQWEIDMEKLRNEQDALIEEILKEKLDLTKEQLQNRHEQIRSDLEQLKTQNEELQPIYEEKNLRKDVNFLIQPQDWIFYGGIGFTISALSAIITSLFEPQISKMKPYPYFLGISIIAMFIGFGYLSLIFYKIGGLFQ